MQLLMTKYTAADADTVEALLPAAVDHALDVAAARIGAERAAAVTTRDAQAFRVEGGLRELAGCSVSVVRHPELVEIQIRVPWGTDQRNPVTSPADTVRQVESLGPERRSLAAAAFARDLGSVVGAA